MVFQFLELGGLFILSGSVIFFMISLLAGSLGQWLNRSSRAQLILNKVAGVVFVGLALKIATVYR